MPNKTENLQSKLGKDTRRSELAIVIALLIAAIVAPVVLADSSQWDSYNCAMVADFVPG